MCGLSNYLRVHPIHVREKIVDRITMADAMVHAKGDASMQAAFDMAAVTLASVAKGYHDFVEFEEI